jgi:hypothetical protein
MSDYVLKASGERVEVSPRDGKKYSLKEMQSIVGGLIERIRLPSGEDMWVNEEGAMLRLLPNEAASALAGLRIVGDVLVCKTKRVK